MIFTLGGSDMEDVRVLEMKRRYCVSRKKRRRRKKVKRYVFCFISIFLFIFIFVNMLKISAENTEENTHTNLVCLYRDASFVMMLGSKGKLIE